MFSFLSTNSKNNINSKNSTNGKNGTNNTSHTINSKNNVTNTNRNKEIGNTSTVLVQSGGVAPINFRYPANMEQPSKAIMEWATTSGVPTPPSSEIRGVAHGGKRHNKKSRRVIKKSHHKTRKQRAHQRKTRHRN